MRKARLLVVDDEPQLVELLRLTLELQGYQVRGASSGPEALELAQSVRFDVVILDVMMSPWNGFETAERLRALPEAPRLLFLTGLVDQDSTARGLGLGEAYLTKPFRPAELITKIAELLGSPRP